MVQLRLSPGQTLLINGIGVGVAEALGATPVPYVEGVGQRVQAVLPEGVGGIFDLVGGAALRSIAG